MWLYWYIIIVLLFVIIFRIKYYIINFIFQIIIPIITTKLRLKLDTSDDGITSIVGELVVLKFGEFVIKFFVPIPSIGRNGVNWREKIGLEIEILKLTKQADGVVVPKTATSKPSRALSLIRYCPNIVIDSISVSVRHVTGGWTSLMTIDSVCVTSDLVQVGSVVGTCQTVDRRVKFLNIMNFKLRDQVVSVDTLTVNVSMEMFYQILPTISPLIELPKTLGIPGRQIIEPKSITVQLSVVVRDKIQVSVSTDSVGICTIEVLKISAQIDSVIIVKGSGCVIVRDSPIHGISEIARLPPFSMTGSVTSLEVNIPRATINLTPDGIVYWIRAMIMLGT